MNVICKNGTASDRTAGSTFINCKIPSALKNPTAPSKTAKNRSTESVCDADLLTIFWFFAPAYCAMRIVPAIENPMPSDKIKKYTVPLAEDAATASCDNFPIQ